jgi:hypothetical protein
MRYPASEKLEIIGLVAVRYDPARAPSDDGGHRA